VVVAGQLGALPARRGFPQGDSGSQGEGSAVRREGDLKFIPRPFQAGLPLLPGRHVPGADLGAIPSEPLHPPSQRGSGNAAWGERRFAVGGEGQPVTAGVGAVYSADNFPGGNLVESDAARVGTGRPPPAAGDLLAVRREGGAKAREV